MSSTDPPIAPAPPPPPPGPGRTQNLAFVLVVLLTIVLPLAILGAMRWRRVRQGRASVWARVPVGTTFEVDETVGRPPLTHGRHWRLTLLARDDTTATTEWTTGGGSGALTAGASSPAQGLAESSSRSTFSIGEEGEDEIPLDAPIEVLETPAGRFRCRHVTADIPATANHTGQRRDQWWAEDLPLPVKSVTTAGADRIERVLVKIDRPVRLR